MLLFYVLPVPMWLLLPSYIAWDSYWLNAENSTVGHAAHLGGVAFGGLFYLGFMRARFGGILPKRF